MALSGTYSLSPPPPRYMRWGGLRSGLPPRMNLPLSNSLGSWFVPFAPKIAAGAICVHGQPSPIATLICAKGRSFVAIGGSMPRHAGGMGGRQDGRDVVR
jgi:hypothetical protein